MAVIMSGMVNIRTVNLSHLASQFPGNALFSTNYRRLQRFFQDIHLDESVVAGLTTSLLNFDGPKHPEYPFTASMYYWLHPFK